MPEPKSHADNRNWIERILRHVPGFHGYLEKEYRRDSDALQRKFLADTLQRSKTGLDAYARKLADSAQLAALPECDRLRGKLDKAIGRIRGAMQGYSGVFDLVRIDTSALDRVYEFDLKMIEQTEALATKVSQLAASSEKPTDVISTLLQEVDALDQAFNHRSEILQGLE